MLDSRLVEALNSFNAVRESITISDATNPDMPLIYINDGFEHFSGYKREEALGKNCRFLQGHMRDQEGVHILRDAIAKRKGCLVELTNFKKTGERFINRLSIRPIFNKAGILKYFLGLQNDVTILKSLEDKIAQYVSAQAD